MTETQSALSLCRKSQAKHRPLPALTLLSDAEAEMGMATSRTRTYLLVKTCCPFQVRGIHQRKSKDLCSQSQIDPCRQRLANTAFMKIWGHLKVWCLVSRLSFSLYCASLTLIFSLLLAEQSDHRHSSRMQSATKSPATSLHSNQNVTYVAIEVGFYRFPGPNVLTVDANTLRLVIGCHSLRSWRRASERTNPTPTKIPFWPFAQSLWIAGTVSNTNHS